VGHRPAARPGLLDGPAVCRAIVDTGFKGYLAHEFVPTRDPLTSLREAVALCDV
jgi:hydroxypyruvate isomerase